MEQEWLLASCWFSHWLPAILWETGRDNQKSSFLPSLPLLFPQYSPICLCSFLLSLPQIPVGFLIYFACGKLAGRKSVGKPTGSCNSKSKVKASRKMAASWWFRKSEITQRGWLGTVCQKCICWEAHMGKWYGLGRAHTRVPCGSLLGH